MAYFQSFKRGFREVITAHVRNPKWWFAGFITGSNLGNIHKKKCQNNTCRVGYAFVSVVKGVIYGSLYPMSALFILMDDRPGGLKKHTVPLSEYGICRFLKDPV